MKPVIRIVAVILAVCLLMQAVGTPVAKAQGNGPVLPAQNLSGCTPGSYLYPEGDAYYWICMQVPGTTRTVWTTIWPNMQTGSSYYYDPVLGQLISNPFSTATQPSQQTTPQAVPIPVPQQQSTQVYGIVPNGICTQQGAIAIGTDGRGYICVWAGNQLVWFRPVGGPGTTPVPSPTPAPAQTTTKRVCDFLWWGCHDVIVTVTPTPIQPQPIPTAPVVMTVTGPLPPAVPEAGVTVYGVTQGADYSAYGQPGASTTWALVPAMAIPAGAQLIPVAAAPAAEGAVAATTITVVTAPAWLGPALIVLAVVVVVGVVCYLVVTAPQPTYVNIPPVPAPPYDQELYNQLLVLAAAAGTTTLPNVYMSKHQESDRITAALGSLAAYTVIQRRGDGRSSGSIRLYASLGQPGYIHVSIVLVVNSYMTFTVVHVPLESVFTNGCRALVLGDMTYYYDPNKALWETAYIVSTVIGRTTPLESTWIPAIEFGSGWNLPPQYGPYTEIMEFPLPGGGSGGSWVP